VVSSYLEQVIMLPYILKEKFWAFHFNLVSYHNLGYLWAKSLQSCLTVCDPMDCSPLGSSVHGILQAKNTGMGYHALLQGSPPSQGWNLHLLDLLNWEVGVFFVCFLGFFFFLTLAPPGKSNGKESTYKAGDAGLIPGSVRSPGEVFLPGKFHGQRKLGGYPGVSELDLTEQLTLELFAHTIKFLLSFWRQPSWSEGYPWDE